MSSDQTTHITVSFKDGGLDMTSIYAVNEDVLRELDRTKNWMGRKPTGKKLEVPVKRILAGAEPSDVLSLGAVDDPTALDAFVALARSRSDLTPTR